MLDRFIFRPRLMEVDHVDVAAPPERVYETARHLDLASSAWIRALFALRTLPLSIDDLGRQRPGFRILADEPGRGFAVGAIGRFWKLEIPFVDVEPEQFASFSEPGYARVAWALESEPHGDAGTRLWLELRLDATDDEAWRKVRRYFRVVGPFSRLIRRHTLALHARELGSLESSRADGWRDATKGALGALAMAVDLATPFARPARSHWGLDADAADRDYPGDELIVDPVWGWTHAVEVDAPPEAVWPWLAQIGQDKAGFYSLQFLENLVGCDIHNADRIHPEWTRIGAGDWLRLHPNVALPIVRVEHGHWFVAHVSDPSGRSPSVSWLFLVEPLGDGKSRVISRLRSRYQRTLPNRLRYGPFLTESIGFVMDKKMLQGIRDRVEQRFQH